MKLNVYAIYDNAIQAFAQPFFMQTDGLAVRAFQDMVNAQEENNISLHPDQFTLFKLSQYEDQTGAFIQTEPESLGNGLTFKQVKSAHTITEEQLEKLFQYMSKQGYSEEK
jgi:hypothetical protein